MEITPYEDEDDSDAEDGDDLYGYFDAWRSILPSFARQVLLMSGAIRYDVSSMLKMRSSGML